MISICHFFSHFRTLGGVETVLQQHYAHDSAWGMDSRFVIFDEKPDQPIERVQFLGVGPSSTIRGLRRSLQTLRNAGQPLVAVYHGARIMGVLLCEYDLAARRVMYLHGKGDGLEEALAVRRTWVDGVVSVSQDALEIARKHLPGLPPGNFITVPVPIVPCADLADHAPLQARPILVGYCGRFLKEHKRVDRLPELCGFLERQGIDYRLELLGDGPERSWLEDQFRANQRAQFLGRRNGEHYRRALTSWDIIVFVSDTEGQPVSLVEAMSGGVIPVFPGINSAGDDYVRKVDERLLYPAGDMNEAARVIAMISRAPDGDLRRWRSRSRNATGPNSDGTYFKTFAAFTHQLLDSPRQSTNQFPWRPGGLDWIPLSWLSRAALARRRLLKILLGIKG